MSQIVNIGNLPTSDVLDTVTSAGGVSNSYSTWKTTSTSNNIRIITGSDQVSSTTGSGTGSTSTIPAGTPAQCLACSATESPAKAADGHLVSLVSVDYIPAPGDKYFNGVQVWFVGYNGSSTPTLIAQGTDSPISFVCETTHETVTIKVLSYGSTGLTPDYKYAPSCTVALDGVQSAPPSPTISESLTALPNSLGWQFSFNCINGLEGDVIDGYWIYRSTSATTPTPPSSRFNYMKQPASGIGVLTVSDITSSTYNYWVSAVNTSGLESEIVSAVGHVNKSLYPATYTGTYVSPTSAYDGNETTCSAGYDTDVTMTPKSIIWSGFPALATPPTSANLMVLSEVERLIGMIPPNLSGEPTGPNQGTYTPPPATPGVGEILAALDYSLDGGATWTSVYSTKADRDKAYDAITIPPTQDMTQVQVRASVKVVWGQAISAVNNIYELRVDYVS